MRLLRTLPLLMALGLAACTGGRSGGVAESPQVQIVDPGQILSAPALRTADGARNEAQSQGVTAAGWDEIIRLSQESEWPREMQDLASRNARRDEIRAYRAFRVATIGEHAILLIPADQGGAVPAGMQGRKFYVVIAQSAITLAR